MQSTFRILSEMDGTLARQVRAPAIFTLPRLPHAVLIWLAALVILVLAGATSTFDLTARLGLVGVAVLHALGCVFFACALNGDCGVTFGEALEKYLAIAAATWMLPVVAMTMLGNAQGWETGMAAIGLAIAVAMNLLAWPIRLSRLTGANFGTSFCHAVLANLIIASPLSVVFALALGLAAWLT
ncbi:MAG: hypothetical protein HC855_07935 [Rhizobiales bacterium]|nr:hypothetical protein [Hyphomicrobiales bacterium]